MVRATESAKRSRLESAVEHLWKKRKVRKRKSLVAWICDHCHKQYGTRNHLARHVLIHQRQRKAPASGTPIVPVAPPSPKVTRRRKLNYLPLAPQGLPEPENPLFVPTAAQLIEEGYDPDVVPLIREHWRFCCTSYRTGRILKRYNVRVHPKIGLDVDYLASILRAVYHNQTQRFKINFDFAIMLMNQVEKTFRFYWSGNAANGAMVSPYWDAPVMINSLEDLENRISLLDHGDLVEYLSLNRPDSKWTIHSVVNLQVSVFTNTFSGPLMGHSSQHHALPDYLMRSKSIHTAFCDRNGRPYGDNLCFFRCLQIFFLLKKISPARTAKQLAEAFAAFMGRDACSKGVRIRDMLHLEKAFKIRIFIYSLQSLPTDDDDSHREGARARAVRIKSGLRKNEATNGDLYLDLYTFPDESEHLSFISKFDSYSKWFYCSTCGYGNSRSCLVLRHERTCAAKPQDRVRSVGGGFAPPDTVFDKLTALGFPVDDDLRYYPWVSCYDIETMDRHLPTDEQRSRPDSGLCWETSLELISVAVSSSVPQFTEPLFLRRISTERELVDRLVEYMVRISEHASELNRLRLAELFERVDAQLTAYGMQETDAGVELSDFAAAQKAELGSLRSQLETFADSHVFYAYNGGRFDLKVLRNHLWNAFLDRGMKFKKLIKREGSYILAATDKITLKAAGVSLDGWVKSLGLSVAKQPFCYDYITSLAVLEEPDLPPQDKFFSTLRQTGISDEDYEQLKQYYKSKKFSCIYEWLEDYNLNDVIILLEALKCMVAFWRSVGLDVVTEASTLPSMSSKLMNKLTPSDKPPLFVPSRQNYDMFVWLQRGIVGGPSIVFRRLTCVGVTTIRQTENICRKQLGFDANSLYLYCMSLPMPTSIPCKWTPEGGVFKKEFCLPKHVSVAETEYCHYLKHELGSEGEFLFSYFHKGQKRLGKDRRFSADAISFRMRTVWSFDGCYFHVCEHCPAGRRAFAKNPNYGTRRRGEDADRNKYIKAIGYQHVIMRECEWRQTRQRPKIRKYLTRTLYTANWDVRELTERQILRAVQQGMFFGLLLVNIECPETLKDYFAEFPPIFLNIDLGREHLSEEMLQFAERNDLLRQPRRSLVSVRSGDYLLLISPMLKWLVDHGLKCTKLHSAYEFKPFKMYKDFTERVIKERTKADEDIAFAPTGQNWKMSGNSSYGRTLLSTHKFLSTTVCTAQRASNAVNLKSFRQLEPLSDDISDRNARYEVTTLPRRFTERNPRYLGAFILGHAKLRMVEFYYDFLLKFWSTDEFELQYTDTDSIYLGIASASWEEHESKIRPGMRALYESEKGKFLADKHNARTPGLFKVEYECEVCVALAAKTYICIEKVTADIAERCRRILSQRTGKQWPAAAVESFSETGGGTKVSSKGCNKRTNSDILRIDRFLDVLETQETVNCCNRGFRCVEGKMFKYSLTKSALSFLYGKRRVNADFSTEPLW